MYTSVNVVHIILHVNSVCVYMLLVSLCSLQDYDYIVYILKKLPEFLNRDENELR